MCLTYWLPRMRCRWWLGALYLERLLLTSARQGRKIVSTLSFDKERDKPLQAPICSSDIRIPKLFFSQRSVIVLSVFNMLTSDNTLVCPEMVPAYQRKASAEDCPTVSSDKESTKPALHFFAVPVSES